MTIKVMLTICPDICKRLPTKLAMTMYLIFMTVARKRAVKFHGTHPALIIEVDGRGSMMLADNILLWVGKQLATHISGN